MLLKVQLIILNIIFHLSSGKLLEKAKAKITGGPRVSVGTYPYQLALEFQNGTFICGAVLLNPGRALTAAHCTINHQVSDLAIRAGTTVRGQNGTIRNATGICNHPAYNSTNFDNDLAVVILDGEFTSNNQISAIAVATIFNYLPDGAEAVVTGWGANQLNGPLATDLHAVTLMVIPHIWCQLFFRGINSITSNMLCTGRLGRGICTGDAGGPLTYINQLFGIVSRDNSCGRFNVPGVYTDVRKYTDFINNCQLEDSSD